MPYHTRHENSAYDSGRIATSHWRPQHDDKMQDKNKKDRTVADKSHKSYY